MDTAMPGTWIELVEPGGARKRFDLKRGLTVIGGAKADITAPGLETDQIHVWDQPPKLIYVGFGSPPTLAGHPIEERALRSGDVIEWRGLRLEFGGLMNALIEEISVEPIVGKSQPARPVASTASPTAAAPISTAPLSAPATMGVDEVLWRRLKAGMAVELGMADSSVARRWQDAILRSEFDADACARDILSAAPNLNDAKLGERATRLQRDLVMAPVAATARGSARKLKGAAQSMAAMLISQFVVLAICLLLVMVALFVVRVRWEWSVDAFFDRLGSVFTG